MQGSDGAKPTVYVVEQQAFDYSPAEVFGNVVFMEAKRLAPDHPNADHSYNNGVIHRIKRELGNYVPGYDYIIPTGAPARMLAVGMVLATKGAKHKVLGWDGRTKRYLEYTVGV